MLIKIMTLFKDWVKKLTRYNNTVYMLSNMSDQQLADMGLNRSQIHQVAKGEFVR
jgi:uncharacterized protein YjiS (DUF1127 family)